MNKMMIISISIFIVIAVGLGLGLGLYFGLSKDDGDDSPLPPLLIEIPVPEFEEVIFEKQEVYYSDIFIEPSTVPLEPDTRNIDFYDYIGRLGKESNANALTYVFHDTIARYMYDPIYRIMNELEWMIHYTGVDMYLYFDNVIEYHDNSNTLEASNLYSYENLQYDMTATFMPSTPPEDVLSYLAIKNYSHLSYYESTNEDINRLDNFDYLYYIENDLDEKSLFINHYQLFYYNPVTNILYYLIFYNLNVDIVYDSEKVTECGSAVPNYYYFDIQFSGDIIDNWSREIPVMEMALEFSLDGCWT